MFLNTNKEDRNHYLIELAEQLASEDANLNPSLDYYEIIYNENGEFAFSEEGIVYGDNLEVVLEKIGYGVISIDYHEMGAEAYIGGGVEDKRYRVKAYQVVDPRRFVYPPDIIINFNEAEVDE